MFPFDAQKIHEAALAVLKEVGVVFHSQAAIDIFRRHGAKIDGNYVYIRPDEVQKALDSAPNMNPSFILEANSRASPWTSRSAWTAVSSGSNAQRIT